uniref:Uncharacterized protein n=1 Tax=Anguilla anguilla TaxID=7936 RepID=A0A0E9RIN1_ANGAN
MYFSQGLGQQKKNLIDTAFKK